jgi:hypothetical protein
VSVNGKALLKLSGLRQAGALILVFVFWFFGANPTVAADAKFGLEAKPRFASMSVFIPIRDPADAVTDDSSSPASSGIRHFPIGSYFRPKLLATQNLVKLFGYPTLNVDAEVRPHKDFASHFDILGYGFAYIERKDRSPDENVVVNFPSRNLNSVNFDLRSMGCDEFFTGKLDLIVTSAVQRNCCDPQTYRGESQYQIEQRDRIARHLLPEGLHSSCLYPVFLAAS